MHAATAPASTRSRAVEASDLAFIAVFAALIAAMSLLPAIPIAGLAVPITLQTLAISLTGLILGPVRAPLAVLLWLVVGSAGIPVFSGGKAGLAVFAGPTAGYLVAFVFAALFVGLAARAILRRGLTKLTPLWLLLTLLVVRVVVMYPLGTLGMARAAGRSFGEMALVDLAFWPGDLIKSILAVLVAVAVHKAFPRLAR